MSKGKIIFKRTIKVLIYLLLTLAVILLSLWFFINSNYGKHFIKNQAQHYLQQKLKTNVSIGKLNYDLPNGIELGNIYIEDQNKDTLLFAGKINVSIKMLDLLYGEVNIKKIYLSGVYANFYSSKEKPEFNYQFIIDAFAGNDSNKLRTV
jgi:autotransporter translocation and assembly factor TamB